MRTTTIEVEIPDGRLPIYDVEPDSAPASAVIVIQEAYGVNDHIEDVVRRLAAAGHRAVAPHLYHRDGVNALPYDFEVAKPHMDNLRIDGIRADINGCIEHLAAAGFPLASVGIVGFCMGGTVAAIAASDHAFGAAVTFYGGGIADGRFGSPPITDLAPRFVSPWLGLFGDLDPSIPVEQVERLRLEAAKAAVPTSVVRYPEAGHAFHCDARPANYHPASAADAWSRALDWLGRHLRPRG